MTRGYSRIPILWTDHDVEERVGKWINQSDESINSMIECHAFLIDCIVSRKCIKRYLMEVEGSGQILHSHYPENYRIIKILSTDEISELTTGIYVDNSIWLPLTQNVVEYSRIICYYTCGVLHRDHLPAVITKDGWLWHYNHGHCTRMISENKWTIYYDRILKSI